MMRARMSDEERKVRRAAARAKWRAANPEKDAQAKRKWLEENRDVRNAKAREKKAAARTEKPEKTAEQKAQAQQGRLCKKRECARRQRRVAPEHVKAIQQKTTAKHRVRRNAEKAAWAKKNASRVRAWTRARQAAKLQRTPAWLIPDDFWMMEQAYELAQMRTKVFGFAWHVDHKVPLQGKLVSGLHVPINLQVIPGVDNVRKGNRYG